MAETKRIAIDLEDLTMALQADNMDGMQYLNRETGEIEFYYDGMLNGEEVDEEEAEAILASDRYQRIDGIGSSRAFRVMEAFIEALPAGEAARQLERALRGRKPFRAFKDTLVELGPVRDEWFRFEREAYRGIAQEWLDENEIEADLVTRSAS